MPFDSTTFRQPSVTVLPPQPPERGGSPQRIVTNIEIVDRRGPYTRIRTSGYRFGTFTLTLLILAMLAALAGCTAAHAQPTSRDSYRQGSTTYDHWQDTNGWHGETRRQGTTTDWTDYGPRGEVRHCHQYFVGDQPYTSCN